MILTSLSLDRNECVFEFFFHIGIRVDLFIRENLRDLGNRANMTFLNEYIEIFTKEKVVTRHLGNRARLV